MIVPAVHAPDISRAWIDAVRAVDAVPDRRALHTVVAIEDPTAENNAIRAEADRLLEQLKYPPIETVANTIFPQQLAATSRDHNELVRRYRAIYPELRRRWHANAAGTYFGRLVAYPDAPGADLYDQLGEIIRKLEREHARNNAKTALYEASLCEVGVPEDAEPTDDVEGANAMIYAPGRDKLPVGNFPCLSHCSFQLDRGGRLHSLAQYRSQYLVQRAYGNYLGLGRLLAYLCEQTGLQVGTLTVVAGYAQIEKGTSRLRPILARQIPAF